MLAYERIGSGEPLVLLHGIGHRRQAWEPVARRLAEHREVIMVDLPGHGESDRLVTAGRSPEVAMRDALLEFFAEQGLDRPHVAGNSLGGWLALGLADAGAARSVTALSPAGFWYSRADFGYTCVVFGVVAAVATVVRPVAPLLCRSAAGRFALFGWINSRPGRLAPERAVGDFRAFARARGTVLRFVTAGRPFRRDVSARVPVTVAWAGRDLVLPRYQARRARSVLASAEHVRLPRCGHVPMGDDPGLVCDTILRGSRPVPGPAAP